MPRAELDEQAGVLILRLSLLERLGALRLSDVKVPLANVAAVSVLHEPWRERPWRGVRVGTGLPWVVLLGLTVGLRPRSADFVAVYRSRPTLVLTLKPGCGWRAVVVTLADAENVAKRLEASLPADDVYREPGGCAGGDAAATKHAASTL